MRAASLTAAVVALALGFVPAAGMAQQQAGSAADARARLARADAAWKAGDRRTAEAEYAAVATLDPGNSRAVYRLAELRLERDLGGTIALYRRYVMLEPNDAWGYLALGKALAARGDLTGSRAAFDEAVRLAPHEREMHVERARELARVQRRTTAWVEPTVGGTRDSDGITTWLTGIAVASPDLGRARLLASASRGAAGDPTASRESFDARVGSIWRATPVLSLELSAGVQRIDRTFIDTAGTGGPGSGPGGQPGGGGRPSVPIGRAPTAGGGATELVPVGRARLVWRDPGGRLRIDARASRQVLAASPYLVAQGVRRDEIGAELDVRVVGPLRARTFGRTGSVHNEAEANERRIVGAAIAWVPAGFDVSVRAQELSYGGPTGLAYFAPRYVRTLELTTYLERELGTVQIALDAGAGAQQVAAWTELPSNWSPTARVWAQLTKPLIARVSLGVEGEAYDSRIGTDVPSFGLPAGRWRYGSLRMWLRAVM
jgi:hypothetical protein